MGLWVWALVNLASLVAVYVTIWATTRIPQRGPARRPSRTRVDRP